MKPLAIMVRGFFMMKTFLQEITETIYSRRGSFDDIVFVLPSKRASLFLKQHIARLISKPIFVPKTYSIEELIQTISGLEKLSDLELLLNLYEAFKPLLSESEIPFETFIPWGTTVLSDFNEIDRNLVSPTSLFTYLTEAQRLKDWGADKKATPLISDTLKFWSQLPEAYERFQKKLLERELAYQGLQYREAALKADEFVNNNTDKDFHFVGFNALNTAEEHILDFFYNNGNSTFWWDIDAHFLDDPIHEAGFFIRDYLKKWPKKSQTIRNTGQPYIQKESIKVIGVPKAISQVKHTGLLLDDILNQDQVKEHNVALVLSDEALLDTMLGILPQSSSKVNITMGQPLIKTGAFHFFDALFQMYLNVSVNGWFYKDVIRVLSSPYCKKLSGDPRDNGTSLTMFIKTKNLLFLNEKTIQPVAPSKNSILNQIIKGSKVSSEDFITLCQNILRALKDSYEASRQSLELHFLYGFYRLFNQLQHHITTKPYLNTLRSIYPLFNELVLNEQLDFKGEPLGGLQIMGVLETRNLDFETVIITSVNEGILPAGKSQNSFIPYDIKKVFGLPTYKEKDAIYAYHFYRLLQRAKNVYILYNTEPDILQGNEKSRFISQLLTDNAIAGHIEHQIAAPEIKNQRAKAKSITKTPALLQLLQERALQGFSPSSLSNYIRNPYDFYIKNILRLNEVDIVEESIAPNTFGTIVHDTLENLYQPLLGKTLDSNYLTSLKKEVKTILERKFEEHFSSHEIKNGQNLIAFHVIQKYINAIVALDISRTRSNEIVLLALEENLKINLNIPGCSHSVVLKGKLDRLERINGTLNILDYKTGTVVPSEVEINALEECVVNEKHSKAFQLLCYALMKQKETRSSILFAGIVPIKSLGGGILSFAQKEHPRGPKNHHIEKELLMNFEQHLIQLIQEILNPEIPFTESESSSF